jgi:glutamine synthetase
MREPGGIQAINEAIKKLEKRRGQHIAIYGEDDEPRRAISMTSPRVLETVGASIRIPRQVSAKGYGYMEDRRPASNAGKLIQL